MHYPIARIYTDKFELTEDWYYKGYKVHKGFYTDLASVPKPLNGIIPAQGDYSYSALLHDFLYTWPHKMSRKEVDQLFYNNMVEDGVSKWKAKVMYRAVRWFGGKHFNRTGEDYYEIV